MINTNRKHQMLRLDLLQSHTINQFPNKILYQYPDQVDWPLQFRFKNFRNQLVIEKDINANVLWLERSFFDEIKFLYQMCSLANDDEFVKHDLETNFFNVNETIGAAEFNPSGFGNGMQIKIADEYGRSIWDGLMEK
jgi:hypothetical protein